MKVVKVFQAGRDYCGVPALDSTSFSHTNVLGNDEQDGDGADLPTRHTFSDGSAKYVVVICALRVYLSIKAFPVPI